MNQKVAILGASPNQDRFSYRAFKMLQEYGHTVLPVTPKVKMLEGVPTYPNLSDILGPIDTLTMYVGAEVSSRLKDQILKLRPPRIIFNPGSENPALEEELTKAGLRCLHACTLVLLSTKQFDKA